MALHIGDCIKEIEDNTNHISENNKLRRKTIQEHEFEMVRNQLNNIHPSQTLRPTDIKRIAKYTTGSIFHKTDCAIWTGYITNMENKKKGTYVNFYFKNKKKVALHRLLYTNYVGKINADEYIKYSCPNKGICCNVNHMIKFQYTYVQKSDVPNNKDKKKNKKETKQLTKDDFTITIY